MISETASKFKSNCSSVSNWKALHRVLGLPCNSAVEQMISMAEGPRVNPWHLRLKVLRWNGIGKTLPWRNPERNCQFEMTNNNDPADPLYIDFLCSVVPSPSTPRISNSNIHFSNCWTLGRRLRLPVCGFGLPFLIAFPVSKALYFPPRYSTSSTALEAPPPPCSWATGLLLPFFSRPSYSIFPYSMGLCPWMPTWCPHQDSDLCFCF